MSMSGFPNFKEELPSKEKFWLKKKNSDKEYDHFVKV